MKRGAQEEFPEQVGVERGAECVILPVNAADSSPSTRASRKFATASSQFDKLANPKDSVATTNSQVTGRLPSPTTKSVSNQPLRFASSSSLKSSESSFPFNVTASEGSDDCAFSFGTASNSNAVNITQKNDVSRTIMSTAVAAPKETSYSSGYPTQTSFTDGTSSFIFSRSNTGTPNNFTTSTEKPIKPMPRASSSSTSLSNFSFSLLSTAPSFLGAEENAPPRKEKPSQRQGAFVSCGTGEGWRNEAKGGYGFAGGFKTFLRSDSKDEAKAIADEPVAYDMVERPIPQKVLNNSGGTAGSTGDDRRFGYNSGKLSTIYEQKEDNGSWKKRGGSGFTSMFNAINEGKTNSVLKTPEIKGRSSVDGICSFQAVAGSATNYQKPQPNSRGYRIQSSSNFPNNLSSTATNSSFNAGMMDTNAQREHEMDIDMEDWDVLEEQHY